MSDSTNNLQTQKVFVKKQMQYEYEKKEAKVKAEQGKKNLVASEELKQQKQQQNFLLADLLWFLFLPLLFLEVIG